MKTVLVLTLCAILGVSSSEVETDGIIEITPYMINGVRSPVAPYYAFIDYRNQQGHGFFGGGALVSLRHVVTAATNTVGFPSLRVYMGSSNRNLLRHFAVAGSTPHPQYNAQTRANDIAIIRLSTPVLPSAEVNFIALPPRNVNPPIFLPNENEEGSFHGFGFQSISSTAASNFLYQGFQRTINDSRCTAFFNVVPTHAFCGEDNAERSSGCHGDIGNPFVISYRRVDTLVGILSIHPPCGQMSPTAYTRITAFREWIHEQLQIN